jgi:hypothetical protein
MKTTAMWLWLIAAVVGLACVAGPATVRAAEDDVDNREHHEQMQRPMPGKDGYAPDMRGSQLPGRGAALWHACRFLRCVAVVLAIIHVMLAVWVFTDIRKRGEGHGVFVVLALLGGIPATILYALVRIGDRKT